MPDHLFILVVVSQSLVGNVAVPSRVSLAARSALQAGIALV